MGIFENFPFKKNQNEGVGNCKRQEPSTFPIFLSNQGPLHKPLSPAISSLVVPKFPFLPLTTLTSISTNIQSFQLIQFHNHK